MKILLFLLINLSLFSCSPSVEVETSGLVINEKKNEFYLHGKEISEEQAYDYFNKNSKSNEIVVFVEGDKVGVYTFNEATEITAALFKAIFSHIKPSIVK